MLLLFSGTSEHAITTSQNASKQLGTACFGGQWCKALVRDLILYMLCLGMSYATIRNSVLFVHVAAELA